MKSCKLNGEPVRNGYYHHCFSGEEREPWEVKKMATQSREEVAVLTLELRSVSFHTKLHPLHNHTEGCRLEVKSVSFHGGSLLYVKRGAVSVPAPYGFTLNPLTPLHVFMTIFCVPVCLSCPVFIWVLSNSIRILSSTAVFSGGLDGN